MNSQKWSLLTISILFAGLTGFAFEAPAAKRLDFSGLDNATASAQENSKTAKEEMRLNPNSLDQYRNSIDVNGLRNYLRQMGNSQDRRKVKVAILDKGFKGWAKRRGKSLPANVKYIGGPLPVIDQTFHGTLMAEIMTSMLWGADWEAPQKENLPFQLRLYNVAGFTNFKAAIDDLIAAKVDLVLYSEVWELGGNSDGRGFINREVNRATRAGVIWINAAGNFGGRVYNGPIRVLENSLVQLPGQDNTLDFYCEPAQQARECPVKITLNWNYFSDNSEQGTNADLDLALFDQNSKKVQTSILRQVNIRGEAGEGQSKYPREAIAASLKPGYYRIMVRSPKKAQWRDTDRLRVMVDGDFVRMPWGDRNETLQNPADNPSVITVGASDSDRSSSSRYMGKPEIMGPSNVMEWYGQQFKGSSNAAALAMSKAVLLKYLNPNLDRNTMVQSLLTPLSNSY